MYSNRNNAVRSEEVLNLVGFCLEKSAVLLFLALVYYVYFLV